MVQKPPSLAAGGDPTCRSLSLSPAPVPHHLRQYKIFICHKCCSTFSSLLLNIQRKALTQEKKFTGEKGALPESMNPCRDFTFAIDFMHGMLRYSDSI